MEAGCSGRIEILVHASAPSRGIDDARYRALAAAYPTFQPVSRLVISHDEVLRKASIQAEISPEREATYGQRESQQEDRQIQPLPAPLDEGDRNQQRGHHLNEYESNQTSRSGCRSPVGKIHFTRSSLKRSLDSPQVSFDSVFDNADSPTLRSLPSIVRTPPPNLAFASNDGSWETPASIVADSQSTYNRAIPELSSPTRVLELYLQHFENLAPCISSPNGQKDQGAVQVERSDELHHSPVGLVSALEARSRTSAMQHPRQIQSVLRSFEAETLLRGPVVARASSSHVKAVSDRTRSKSDSLMSTDRMSSSLSQTHQSAATQSQTGREASPSLSDNIANSPIFPIPSVSFDSSVAPSSSLPPPLKRPRRKLPRAHPHEIHPPLPPTSSANSSLASHLVTLELSSLAKQLNLPARFRPARQDRPLRSLERGYWLIPTTSWPPGVRDQSWRDLRDFIGGGRAGWGVWCVRGGDGDGGANAVRGMGKSTHDPWRIYCWGGVADHVWLLLYLVSHRRVKGSGERWIDADGAAVVVMP
ncbi:MAG: hypothetical protein M1818_008254 [Claussenomyces sp. TS43310]|nr:MAG: hypothetical protein M1818_008254 [Claussenomyces sp. TS43310]